MRVLIVDDEPAVLALIAQSLQTLGWTPVVARGYPEGRSLLATKPDALIADVRLNGFNGLQLVIVARLTDPHMRIVVMSGHDDPVIRQEAASYGATFLVKPFTLAQLTHAVTRSAHAAALFAGDVPESTHTASIESSSTTKA